MIWMGLSQQKQDGSTSLYSLVLSSETGAQRQVNASENGVSPFETREICAP